MGEENQSNQEPAPEKTRATQPQHMAYQKAKINPSNLLSTADIKMLFNISESCVKEWRRKRVIPYTRMGGTIFYFKDAIFKMLEERIIYPDQKDNTK